MGKLLQWLGVGYNVAPYMMKNRAPVYCLGMFAFRRGRRDRQAKEPQRRRRERLTLFQKAKHIRAQKEKLYSQQKENKNDSALVSKQKRSMEYP